MIPELLALSEATRRCHREAVRAGEAELAAVLANIGMKIAALIAIEGRKAAA